MSTNHPNNRLQRERILKGWSQKRLAEEIGTTKERVCRKAPGKYFQEQLCTLFGKNAEELGFINGKIIIEETPQAAPSTTPITSSLHPQENDNKTITSSHSSQALSSIIIEPVNDQTEDEDMDKKRRQLLQSTLSTACTILTLSPCTVLHAESNESLMKAIMQPSCIDNGTLDNLSVITRKYWELIDNSPLDFLSGVLSHFQTIMHLLKESHPISIYPRLCSLAGENALVIGRTLYDIQHLNLSQSYFSFAIKIAQEIGNEDLRATGLGRMALLLMYNRQPQHAIILIQKAQQATLQNSWIGAWLFAIEAELHAYRGKSEAFIKAIDTAKSIFARYPLENDIYSSITRYNSSMQLGFEGAGLIRLKQAKSALPVLQQSLAALHPASTRRRATLLTDIGIAYAQQGEVRESCKNLHQALDIIMQTKASITFQRIYSAQGELDQWQHTGEVKALQEHVIRTSTSIKGAKIGY